MRDTSVAGNRAREGVRWMHLLSFALPACLVLISYGRLGVYPFGERSLLSMDMSAQYVDFYMALRRMVLEGNSLFFSWEKTLGTGFAGAYAYYLASPFSFLVLLFSETHMTEFLLFMNVLKLGLAGLAFSVFLERVYKKSGLLLPAFSVMYALMSYAAKNSMNLMWLDGLIWLPLIALAIHRLVNRGKVSLLVFCLAMMFVSNYYIAYMVGVFSALYFLYVLLGEQKLSWRVSVGKCLRFGASVLLAFGLSAWIVLPVYYDMRLGKVANGFSLPEFSWNFGIYELLGKSFPGVYDSLTYSGFPDIYCGMAAWILLVAFFLNRSVSSRRRGMAFVLMAFLLLSFAVKPLNIAWHAFQSPNWFLYRYAFVFCFFALVLAYEGLLQLEYLDNRTLYAVLGLVFYLAWGLALREDTSAQPTDWMMGAGFSLFYVFVLYHMKTIEWMWNLLSGVFLLLILLEFGYNTFEMYRGVDEQFGFELRSDFVAYQTALEPAVRQVEAYDRGFYRMEKTFERKMNDAISYGYKGVSHYSSAYNASLNRFLKNAGMEQEYFWTAYRRSSPITDAIFDIKYILSKDDRVFDYAQVFVRDDIRVFENTNALGLGAAVPNSAVNLPPKSEEMSSIAYNGLLLDLLAGSTTGVISDIDEVAIDLEACHDAKASEDGYLFVRDDRDAEAAAVLTIKPEKSGLVYFSVQSPYQDNADVYVDGEYRGNVNDMKTDQNFCVGYYEANASLQIELVLTDVQFYADAFNVELLDAQRLRETMQMMRRSALVVEESGPTFVSGKLMAEKAGRVWLSIPFDPSWEIRVDGAVVAGEPMWDTFLSFEIPQGDHRIELIFNPMGLKAGGIISLISLVGFLALIFIEKRKRERQPGFVG